MDVGRRNAYFATELLLGAGNRQSAISLFRPFGIVLSSRRHIRHRLPWNLWVRPTWAVIIPVVGFVVYYGRIGPVWTWIRNVIVGIVGRSAHIFFRHADVAAKTKPVQGTMSGVRCARREASDVSASPERTRLRQ